MIKSCELGLQDHSPSVREECGKFETRGSSKSGKRAGIHVYQFADSGLILSVVVDAAGAVEAFLPVSQFHTFDTNLSASGGRVDEFVVA